MNEKMLSYHETKTDELILDNEPLLSDLKRHEYLIKEKHPIFVNECYYKNMIKTYQVLDENENVCKRELGEMITQNETISGIFVVSFDIRLGNMVEWQIPSELNLEGVEFKAIASGLHMVQNDIV